MRTRVGVRSIEVQSQSNVVVATALAMPLRELELLQNIILNELRLRFVSFRKVFVIGPEDKLGTDTTYHSDLNSWGHV